MRMPNFLLIGAQKAGTTSLYHYLRQHPQVFMSPIKEPNFFAFFEGEDLDFRDPVRRDLRTPWVNSPWRLVADLDSYRLLFANVTDEIALGEASPTYLYNEKAAERICRYLPEVKLITILRDPTERAYSHFLQLRKSGLEPLADFARALDAEKGRTRDNWRIGHYRRMGFYHEQLARYYKLFEPEQIRVYLYEDLKEDPVGMMQSIFRFLEVDDAFVPDTSLRYNVSGIPKSRALHTLMNPLTLLKRPNPLTTVLKLVIPKGLSLRILLNRRMRNQNPNLSKPERLRRRIRVNLKKHNLAAAPPMPEDVREELTEAYREDVLKLQELIGRDLSRWLGKET